MKHYFFAALMVAAATSAGAADVGVTINIGAPGFFGQLSLGGIPQPPPLVFPQPVVIASTPGVVVEPIYLHVPPGHEKHWARHCAEYNACGRPVYFVRDDWYQREYVPHYQRGEWGHEHGRDEERGREDHDRGHGHGRGHDRDRDHERDRDRDQDRQH